MIGDIEKANVSLQAHKRWLTSPLRRRKIKVLNIFDEEYNRLYSPSEFPFRLIARYRGNLIKMPAVDIEHCIELAKDFQVSELNAVEQYNTYLEKWDEYYFNEDGDTIIEVMEGLHEKAKTMQSV